MVLIQCWPKKYLILRNSLTKSMSYFLRIFNFLPKIQLLTFLKMFIRNVWSFIIQLIAFCTLFFRLTLGIYLYLLSCLIENEPLTNFLAFPKAKRSYYPSFIKFMKGIPKEVFSEFFKGVSSWDCKLFSSSKLFLYFLGAKIEEKFK